MELLIRKASLLIPQHGPPVSADVLISDERIKEIGQDIIAPGATVIEAHEKILVPGLVDVHVHFRQPGQEYKEDLHTGSMAAAAGGFTTVIAEPNTVPPIDTPNRLRHLMDLASRTAIVHFYSKAAITQRSMGMSLTDIRRLKEIGAKAISDDGNPIPGRRLMQNALIKGGECGILVNPHCEESALYRERIIQRREKLRRNLPDSQMAGWPAMPYSLPGAEPYTSEEGFIKRDVELAEKTGARLHISHVSLASSVRIISRAKSRGVNVTAEATPHHLLLTKEMANEIGPNAKVNPPLRSEEDVAAVREGLADGTIDIIASDHAPHSPAEKNRGWNQAPFGVIGLETTLGLVLSCLVRRGILTLEEAIGKMTIGPARIFGIDGLGVGRLSLGAKADLTLIDLEKKWRVDAGQFYSKGRNCPFDGWELCGRAVLTIVSGKVVAEDGKVLTEALIS